MKMRRKFGTFCVVIGTVFILGALSLFLYNQWDSWRAGQYADGILSDLSGVDESDLLDSDETGMSEVSLDGTVYIGWISIPAISIELPVAGQWSYAQLRQTPCRYTGSIYTDDLVICAHNYARHFGYLKNLSAGDMVYFTNLIGTVHSYEVVEMEILQPTAVEELITSEYDLTLFTCTYGGKTRVTVRCNEVE